MKIELCFLTVNLLAGLAEVTWYLQSLPGEKKVKLFLYFTVSKEDECGELQAKSSLLAFLTRLTTLLLILSTHCHSISAAQCVHVCQCCFLCKMCFNVAQAHRPTQMCCYQEIEVC
jgi:hypothetical protein